MQMSQVVRSGYILCVCVNLLTTGQSVATAAESSESVVEAAAQLCPAESSLWSLLFQQWQEEAFHCNVQLPCNTAGSHLCFYTKKHSESLHKHTWGGGASGVLLVGVGNM